MIQSMEILQLPITALQERIEHELQENPVLEVRGSGDEDEVDPNSPEVNEIVEPSPESALPIMALQERIEHELQENPVLEERGSGDEGEVDPNSPKGNEIVEPSPESAPEMPEQELVIDAKSGEEDFERMESLNEDWSDYFNEESRPSSNQISEEMDKKHDAMSNMASRPQSLQDYLNDQLAYVDTEVVNVELVCFLISHLDERGYLATPLEDIRQSFGQDVTLRQVEEALKDLQGLEPTGVGARDYKECLLLQVKHDTPHGEVVRTFIQNHLEDIQHSRLPFIQKKTGYEMKVIHEAIEVLKHLNPRPGAQFVTTSVRCVTPDIIVEKNEQEDYNIRLVDDWTANIYISRSWIDKLRDKNSDEKTREFLQRKIQSAKWLIDAIEQRRSTLMKVTKAIFKHQKAFLDKGPEFIEPLKMQQIADIVKMHVTTVSRAVIDKWVQTPRGIFPLKRFFGTGMKKGDR